MNGQGNNTSVTAALSDYLLQRSWDAFITVTFARPARYPGVAISRVLRCLVPVERAFIAAEPHKLGNWHVHGLAAGLDVAMLKARFDTLGWNRVERVVNQGGVSAYCSKYLLKGGETQWRLVGGRQAWSST